MSKKLLALLIGGFFVLAAGLIWAGWRYTKTPEYRVVHGSPEQQRWAIRLLVEEGADEDDWRQIHRCVASPHQVVSLTAISAIGNAKHAPSLPLLIEIVDSNRPLNLRLRALEALAQIGTSTAWNTVRSALDTPKDRIRRAAISHLARHGRRRAVSNIRACLEDENPDIRATAARALRELLAPATKSTSDAPEVGDSLIFEAEHGYNLQGNFEIAPSKYLRDHLTSLSRDNPQFTGLKGASGKWIRNLEGAGGNHEWLGGESGSINIGRIDYPILIEKKGSYRLWARVWWMDKCGNSFHAWFDHGDTRKFSDDDHSGGPYREWQWESQKHPVQLASGMHTLHIQAREDGIRIDQFMLLPEGETPPEGMATTNYEPLAIAPTDAELALSRHSRIINDEGKLRGSIIVLRGGQNPLTARLKLRTDGGTANIAREQTIIIPESERSWSTDFEIRYPPERRREYAVNATLETPSGEEIASRRMIVQRPWDWLLAGPFSSRQSVEELTERKDIAWKTYPAEQLFDRYGRMDFESIFGDESHGYVYMKTDIHSDEKDSLLWLLNSDDSSRVWLDGQSVIQNPRTAPASAFLIRGRHKIPPGKHTILAECHQKNFPDGHIYKGTQNYWLFRLRIRRSEKTPAAIRGLKTRRSKEE